MDIIAHRGGSEGQKSAENRLQTFEAQLTAPCNMIETDLRMRGDTIVLSHDPLQAEGEYDTLTDLLNLVAGEKEVNLEIKEPEVVAYLKDVVAVYSGKLLISSFDFPTLLKARELLPETEVAVLEKWSGVRATWRARKLNTKRIHMNQRWLWSGFIKSMSAQGYQLHAYTVNSEAKARQFKRAGISGIFTDYPERMSKLG